MTKADDRVLEFLREFGNRQPTQIARAMLEEGVDLDFHANYIGERCRILESYGLLVNVGNGVYSITELGEQYLDGDLDAGTLNEDSEE